MLFCPPDMLLYSLKGPQSFQYIYAHDTTANSGCYNPQVRRQEAKRFAQGHRGKLWQSRDLNQVSLDPSQGTILPLSSFKGELDSCS